jgi:SPP1 gp7 family putative phage head morphogenesis protein
MALRLDDWADILYRTIRSIRIESEQLAQRQEGLLRETAARVSTFNGNERDRIIKSILGVDVFRSEPWLASELNSWVYENASLIESIPQTLLKEVEGITQRGLREGKSSKNLTSEILGRFPVSESRARLIARDQIGKLNSNLTESRQTALGIEEYEWSTSRDERVRESHEVLEGKICRWDDPTVYRDPGSSEWKSKSSIGAFEGQVGQDFQCRCVALPVLDKLLEEINGAR